MTRFRKLLLFEKMEKFEVCSVDALKDGELKDFELNDDVKILLLHKDGKFFASGTKCTHYGAPLIKGSLCGTKVRCPWHGANFDLTTGDIEEFPGCDSIASYSTEVQNGKVFVTLDPAVAKSGKRVMKFAPYNPTQDQRTFVILGGGAAACIASQTLRENGFQGKVVMISQEKYVPYDRVKLSKIPDSDAAKIAIRSPEFYENANIELRLGKVVEKVDCSTKTVTLSGETLKYDSLLVCTGGKPRTIPNVEKCKGVHVLRTPDDGKSLMEDAEGKNVVIIGAGFIGMELSCALIKKSKSVTVLGRDKNPLQNVFGEEIGKMLLKLHETNGVVYKSGVTVKDFKCDGDRISNVILDNGETLSAEVLLVSIGVVPATEFLKGSSVKMDQNGYVEVDEVSCLVKSLDLIVMNLFFSLCVQVALTYLQLVILPTFLYLCP